MLLPATDLIATPPTKEPSAKDLESMEIALRQARLGLEEGGIPIGGALVRGRRTPVQSSPETRHGVLIIRF